MGDETNESELKSETKEQLDKKMGVDEKTVK